MTPYLTGFNAAPYGTGMLATVVGVYGAYYRVRTGEVRNDDHENNVLLAKPRGKLRLKSPKKSYFEPPERHVLAIGDTVEIAIGKENPQEASITALCPRKNCFQRATVYQKHTLGANLTGVIIISSLDKPLFNEGLLARLLTECSLSEIEPVLILNKMDYFDKKNPGHQNTEKIFSYFEDNGYHVFRESFQKQISAGLKKKIARGRFLAFGESGVGKSTFINAILGQKKQAVDESDIMLKGRHITTNPVLYICSPKLELIDAPGIREFGLMHRSKSDIAKGFKEFIPYQCRYENCLHLTEPGCSIKDAVESGELPEFRYQEYCNIMDSMNEKRKPRRGDFRKPG